MLEVLADTYGIDDLNDEPHETTGGLVVSQEMLDEFLTYLEEKGRTPETVTTYRSFLKRVWSHLPESMEIGPDTLANLWKQMESEGFAASTINVSISAANSFLEYYNRRDLQMPLRTRNKIASQPEITRGEYQRLLQTARDQGKERTYLLIKLFACTGINIQEINQITVEFVRAEAKGSSDENVEINGQSEIHIPRCLFEELESYIERENVISGPVFLNKNGTALNRSSISRMISDLSADANVAQEKCNPRCLQRLYQSTQKNIEKNIFLQCQQLHDYMIYQEQQIVGWDSSLGKNLISSVITG